MTIENAAALEKLVNEHGMASVLAELRTICMVKAEKASTNNQHALSNYWMDAAGICNQAHHDMLEPGV